ncbi:MAG: helix-turn-helix transcriptional regulator [Raoultibacter sp.]
MIKRTQDVSMQRQRVLFVRALVALTLLFFSTTLMNTVEFPRFDGLFPYARDLFVGATSCTFIAIALINSFAPRFIRAEINDVVAIILTLAGTLLLEVGLAYGSLLALVVGACCVAAGKAWMTVVVGLACSVMDVRHISLCTIFALLASRALSVVFSFAPGSPVGLVLFYGLLPAAFFLVRSIPQGIFEHARTSDAPVDLALTNPSSFLPFASQVFVCILLMQTAFGFSLRFGPVEGGFLNDVFSLFPLIVVALWVVGERGKYAADALTYLSVLLVVAGFLAVMISGSEFIFVGGNLLSVGSLLFEAVVWTLLLAVASRNELGAISVISWGRGLGGVGSIAGAALAGLAGDIAGKNSTGALVLIALVIMVIVAYALVGLRHFSFEAAIAGTVPVAEGAPRTHEEDFAQACDKLVECYGLTPREREVFELLAKGRNRRYIQEKLVVSRDTVKAHVKHVYTKLDIHSHQELLDLFEEG